jgi:hypothetical protein
MQYGISIDKSELKIIEIQTEADTKAWDVNVLRGFAQGEIDYNFADDKEVTVRIYLPQPGLVISSIEIM